MGKGKKGDQLEMENLLVRKAYCECRNQALKDLIELLQAHKEANDKLWRETVKQIGEIVK